MGQSSRVAEPRFDIDLKYGKQGELQIGEFLDWIAHGNGQVEVKRKRFLDLLFYVETHCDKGRRGNYQPSGISVTTSHAWAFVIGDTGLSVFFPTDLLRSMLDDPSTRDKEESDGSCPTKGKLVSLAVLLYREKKRREVIKAAVLPVAVTEAPQSHELADEPVCVADNTPLLNRDLLDTDFNW